MFVRIIEIFQPTLPARGATRFISSLMSSFLFQPTLPARGATCSKSRPQQLQAISTHAPRTGSDSNRKRWTHHAKAFQPTLPARGATPDIDTVLATQEISTHAPRTGSDKGAVKCGNGTSYFNPRSPHGERRLHILQAAFL